jgi:hypothetical protein
VLDPAHREAVLKIKRKAFHSTPETALGLASAHGESTGAQTAQLMKLLEQYCATALRRAITEALERNTPHASSVAFLLRHLALRRLASISAIIRRPKRSTSALMIWRPTMNSPTPKTTTMANHSLATQLKRVVARERDRRAARMTRLPLCDEG